MEQFESFAAEESSPHEVEQVLKDDLFFDLQRAGVAGDVGADQATVLLEAAAIPVCVALVAAFHRYQHLRDQALAGGPGGSRLGLALLQRRGVSAWTHAWQSTRRIFEKTIAIWSRRLIRRPQLRLAN